MLDDVGNTRYPEMQILWSEIREQFETKMIETMHLKLSKGNGIGVVLNPQKDIC